MKHSLIILISFLLLSSPVIGQETGVLYQWETSSGKIWKSFGDDDTQPKYKGEISNGNPDGFGIIEYPDGLKFVGEYKDGKRNGLGTLYSKYNGEFRTGIKGEWKDGYNWNIKIYNPEGEIIGKYENGVKVYDKSEGVVGKKEKKFNGRWTKQLGTSSGDWGEDVTTDSSGNIYVTGITSGGLDGNTFLGPSDSNFGGGDIFLVKYNSSGIKQWTKQLGTSSRDSGKHVTTDSSGNIFVTGNTSGGLDGNTNYGSDCNYPPCSDIFLVKYNSSGIKQWTKQLGTSSTDVVNGVTTDTSGNIFVTGETGGGLDGNTFLGPSDSDFGGGDIFLVKYNSSGNILWTKQLGTSSRDWGSGVSTDLSGNIYVSGGTKGGLDGNTSSGEGDIILIKFNSSGTKQWTKQLGTSYFESGIGVTTDSSGNIYVSGGTQGGLDGDTNYGNDCSFPPCGDIFLIKFNSSGTKQWTKQLGTSSDEWGYGVTTDSSGNIYVTGHTKGGLDGNTNSGESDIFLVKYNSSGIKQWTKQLGTSSRDSGKHVTTDSSGNIFVTGNTSGGLDGNTNYGSDCNYPPCSDIFLVKYNSSGIKQ